MSEQNAKCTANAVPAKNTAAKNRPEKQEVHKKVEGKVAEAAAEPIAEHMADYDKHTDKVIEETIAEAGVEAEAARRTEADAPYVAIAERYAKYYPYAGEFHITSDRMVFLPGDKADAEAHQRLLGKGELRTIIVH